VISGCFYEEKSADGIGIKSTTGEPHVQTPPMGEAINQNVPDSDESGTFQIDRIDV